MQKHQVELIVWGFKELLKAVPKIAIDIGKLNDLSRLVSKLEKEAKLK